MNSTNKFLFTSDRLGFRNWKSDDLAVMTQINTDPAVMEFLPFHQDKKKTLDFINRMQRQFEKSGFCYFAVERLDTNELIGFIGLMEQNYPADFTPCVDIGWRLAKAQWGNGFASEGAKACLDYAKKTLKIEEIYSIAPKINLRSEKVMQKIGMQKVKEFKHPLLSDYPHLEDCVLYK
jgi:RimJ/RimL family protein N-acetyltransferase